MQTNTVLKLSKCYQDPAHEQNSCTSLKNKIGKTPCKLNRIEKRSMESPAEKVRQEFVLAFVAPLKRPTR